MAGMQTADLVLSYLKVLVWPLIVLVAIVLFRNPIRALLGGLEEFEGFGIKAKINRQVVQAAADSRAALENEPIEKIADDPPILLANIAPNMGIAVEFSSTLITEPSSSMTGPEKMRQAVERLDTAITAVLVVTIVPDSGQQESSPRSWPKRTAPEIERYMAALTGWTGWRGIVDASDILRGGLAGLCGKRAEAVSVEAVTLFVEASNEALTQLYRLVGSVLDAAPDAQVASDDAQVASDEAAAQPKTFGDTW